MIRILIVEDVNSTRKQLEQLFREGIPEAEIHSAARLEPAMALIEQLESAGLHYDAAVLDFLLPSDDPILNDIPNESLCFKLHTTMRECFIVHITGHFADPLVQAHLESHHTSPSSGRQHVFEKQMDWAGKVRDAVRCYVYAKRVEDLLDCLFRPDVFYRGRGWGVADPGDASATHIISHLCCAVEAYWRYLDVDLKRRIKTRLRVLESDGLVKVGLLEHAIIEGDHSDAAKR